MKKRLMSMVLSLAWVLAAHAQIGYQVALIDQTTGKPKANKTVKVEITISDNEGGQICKEEKSATTNDYGILSLEVGKATTFENVDWSKLPLWVTATVDKVTIGKSQILTVPVAEHAKHTGELTVDILCSKTWHFSYDGDYISVTFGKNGIGKRGDSNFHYEIVGNTVLAYYTVNGVEWPMIFHYMPKAKRLLEPAPNYLYK